MCLQLIRYVRALTAKEVFRVKMSIAIVSLSSNFLGHLKNEKQLRYSY